MKEMCDNRIPIKKIETILQDKTKKMNNLEVDHWRYSCRVSFKCLTAKMKRNGKRKNSKKY